MTFVVPMIAYEAGNAAMGWLIEAFRHRWMFEEVGLR